MGANSANTFNPSGIVALFFNQSFEDLDVQTCIFPVRYEDFDQNKVEDVVMKNIFDADLILTTSLNGSNPRFDIEQYATEFRGGFHDNMNIGSTDKQFNSARFIKQLGSGFTETSLPKEKIFGNQNLVLIEGNDVYFDKNRSADEGSGGDYLSNEIMYRSTKVRDTMNLRTPVGHFHLGNLSTISRAEEIINVVFKVIEKILK